MRESEPSDRGWADRPGPQKLIRWILYGICAFLFVAEFFVHRHIKHEIESFPAFYALYGFVALALAIIAGSALRRMIRRDEDYYDRDA